MTAPTYFLNRAQMIRELESVLSVGCPKAACNAMARLLLDKFSISDPVDMTTLRESSGVQDHSGTGVPKVGNSDVGDRVEEAKRPEGQEAITEPPSKGIYTREGEDSEPSPPMAKATYIPLSSVLKELDKRRAAYHAAGHDREAGGHPEQALFYFEKAALCEELQDWFLNRVAKKIVGDV